MIILAKLKISLIANIQTAIALEILNSITNLHLSCFFGPVNFQSGISSFIIIVVYSLFRLQLEISVLLIVFFSSSPMLLYRLQTIILKSCCYNPKSFRNN